MIATHCAVAAVVNGPRTSVIRMAPPIGVSRSVHCVESTPETLGKRGGGVLELVVAPEELFADDHRRHADHAQLQRALGRLAQSVLDRLALNALRDRAGVQLGGC